MFSRFDVRGFGRRITLQAAGFRVTGVERFQV